MRWWWCADLIYHLAIFLIEHYDWHLIVSLKKTFQMVFWFKAVVTHVAHLVWLRIRSCSLWSITGPWWTSPKATTQMWQVVQAGRPRARWKQMQHFSRVSFHKAEPHQLLLNSRWIIFPSGGHQLERTFPLAYVNFAMKNDSITYSGGVKDVIDFWENTFQHRDYVENPFFW